MKLRHSFVAAHYISPCMRAHAFAAAPEKTAILDNYADIAHATYEDSLLTAKKLSEVLNQFLAQPTETNLEKARACMDRRTCPLSTI